MTATFVMIISQPFLIIPALGGFAIKVRERNRRAEQSWSCSTYSMSSFSVRNWLFKGSVDNRRIKMPVHRNIDNVYVKVYNREVGRRQRGLFAKLTYNEYDEQYAQLTIHQQNAIPLLPPSDKECSVKMTSIKFYHAIDLYNSLMYKIQLMSRNSGQLIVNYSYMGDPTILWEQSYVLNSYQAGCRRHRHPGQRSMIPPIPCAHCAHNCLSVASCQHGQKFVCSMAIARGQSAPRAPRLPRASTRWHGRRSGGGTQRRDAAPAPPAAPAVGLLLAEPARAVAADRAPQHAGLVNGRPPTPRPQVFVERGRVNRPPPPQQSSASRALGLGLEVNGISRHPNPSVQARREELRNAWARNQNNQDGAQQVNGNGHLNVVSSSESDLSD